MWNAFEAHGGQPFQLLVLWVYLYADRFQRGDAEQRFGTGIAENDGPAGELSHELHLRESDIHALLAAVGELVHPAAPRFHTDGFQMLAGHEAVRSPGVDGEQAFPCPFRVSGIADGDSDVCCSHALTFRSEDGLSDQYKSSTGHVREDSVALYENIRWHPDLRKSTCCLPAMS